MAVTQRTVVDVKHPNLGGYGNTRARTLEICGFLSTPLTIGNDAYGLVNVGLWCF